MAEKRSALILACNQYEDPEIRQLTAPANDAEALAKVLNDPDIGGFEVKTLINEPSYKVKRAVESFFSDNQRDDLLFLYFSGHGMKDEDDGNLYFATSDTQRKLLHSTAVSANFVNDIMRKSISQKQVLVLDCCYSGAFARGMVAKGDRCVYTREQFEGRGRIVLTASDATHYSFEGNKLEGEAIYSEFTDLLINGLESGEADTNGDGLISLDELYNYLLDKASFKKSHSKPRKWAFDVQGEIIIAKNPRPVAKPSELPLALIQAIGNPLAYIREAAVKEISPILNDAHRGKALAARQELERLAKDDSRKVSEAALKVLLEHCLVRKIGNDSEEAKSNSDPVNTEISVDNEIKDSSQEISSIIETMGYSSGTIDHPKQDNLCEPDVIFCFNCGSKVSPNAIFCGNCGKSTRKEETKKVISASERTYFCAKCKIQYRIGTSFCGKCGKPL
jgi:hypothetical protein